MKVVEHDDKKPSLLNNGHWLLTKPPDSPFETTESPAETDGLSFLEHVPAEEGSGQSGFGQPSLCPGITQSSTSGPVQKSCAGPAVLPEDRRGLGAQEIVLSERALHRRKPVFRGVVFVWKPLRSIGKTVDNAGICDYNIIIRRMV